MGRITRVVHTYYQGPGMMTPFLAASTRETRDTKTHEQPYYRETVVGNGWVRVSTGWIEQASMVIIKNLESTPYRSAEPGVIDGPLPVLELWFGRNPPDPTDLAHSLLSLREVFEISPTPYLGIWVRATGLNPVRYSVTALPY